MSSKIILITILFLVLVTNLIIVLVARIHPEKITGLDLNVDENLIHKKKKWITLLCRLINIGNAISLIGGTVAVYFGNTLLFSLFVSLPVPIGVIYAYHKKDWSDYPSSSNNTRYAIMIGTICLLLVFSAILGVACQSRGNLDVSVNQNELKINGLYGTEILYRDIKEINLQNGLPEIKFRSNGFAVGNTRLGNFITRDDEHIMLFTYSDDCFIRIVKNNGETYYLNCRQSDETIMIFKEIKKHL